MFKTCVFISAEKSNEQHLNNAIRTKILKNLLESFSFNYLEVKGCYEGTEESSFCVETDLNSRELRILRKFANAFNQDSILIIKEDDHAYLNYLNPLKEVYLGVLEVVNPKMIESLENFSIIDNRVYAII